MNYKPTRYIINIKAIIQIRQANNLLELRKEVLQDCQDRIREAVAPFEDKIELKIRRMHDGKDIKENFEVLKDDLKLVIANNMRRHDERYRLV